MSEVINNRKFRKQTLKKLILDLHNGKPVEEAKKEFKKIAEGISSTELAEIEQALIDEGLPVEEVQRLCDVHTALFKEGLEEAEKPEAEEGHPVDILKDENRAIENLINDEIKPIIEKLKKEATKDDALKLLEKINLLMDIDKHYSKKENLIFPYLEKYGITGPPKVMWGVDDEIRDALKECKKMLSEFDASNRSKIIEKVEETLQKVLDMIFKEENILFPMAMETLTQDEWFNIMKDMDEIGFCLIEPEYKWRPQRDSMEKYGKELADENTEKEYIKFETGLLTPSEINLILNHLPVDITFVDKEDTVKYFSQTKDRIFARTKAVIGRKVQNCHPPASVHIVEKLLSDFKEGRKDSEAFWINLNGRLIYIRYFAVRDENGDYMGTLEVTQDITEIKNLTGEKRLLSE